MKLIIKKILSGYSLILVLVLLMTGLKQIRSPSGILLCLLLTPVIMFWGFQKKLSRPTKMGLTIYGLLFSLIIILANGFYLKSIRDLPYVLVFIPVLVSYWLDFKEQLEEGQKIRQTREEREVVIDESKRKFLKIAASAGLMSLGMFLLNRKKAQAAFFGSVPGPGTVAVKDSTGAKIDPATRQPLDGYNISNIDTSTAVHYYGFINKDGDWYIIKEDTNSNTILYAKGESGYAVSNWLTWASSQSYDYFNAKFG